MAQRRSASRNGDFPTAFERIAENIGAVVQGKPGQIRLALTCLIAEGHLLIEDVPGVGKTIGLESMCVGGGQGMAMIVERLN